MGQATEMSLDNGLTFREYQMLVKEAAVKVDLFRAIWDQDPEALIYAGTARDLAYWVLRQFQNARTRADVDRAIESIRAREKIEVREFVARQSDVDVMSQAPFQINAKEFSIKRVDRISFARLNAETERGRTEIDQGFIPLEKIALGRSGIIDLPQFGKPLEEIFWGDLSVHFSPPEVFFKTHYAIEKLNHPILLALRYIRLLAADEYNRFGPGTPRRTVQQLMSEETEARIREIVDTCLNGSELLPYLEKGKFAEWLNSTIEKSYRSHSNKTLANQLMLHFKIHQLPNKYNKIRFVNNYLFAKEYDFEAIEKKLQEYKVNVEEFWTPAEKAFPNLRAYHGASSEKVFYAIVYEGAVPSEYGNAGAGHYVVNENNKSFARNWRGSGDNVVEETLSASARLVDINRGEGRRVYEEFIRKDNSNNENADLFENFCAAFGIDILRYRYSTEAYVIKNSDVIQNYNGAFKKVLTFGKAVDAVQGIRNYEELGPFLVALAQSRLSISEKRSIMSGLPLTVYADTVREQNLLRNQEAVAALMILEVVRDKVWLPDLLRIARRQMKKGEFHQLLYQSTFDLLTGERLSPDLFAAVLNVIETAEELAKILPAVMRRLNEPAAVQFLLENLKKHRNSGELLSAFVRLHFSDVVVPWETAPLQGLPLEPLATFDHPTQLWLALSWLKFGYQSETAIRALERAFLSLSFQSTRRRDLKIKHKDQTLLNLSEAQSEDRVQLASTLRSAAEVLMTHSLNLKALEIIFRNWQYFRFSRNETIQMMSQFNVPRLMQNSDTESINGTIQAFVEVALSTVVDVDQKLNNESQRKADEMSVESIAPQLSLLKLQVPEAFIAFLSDTRFRTFFRIAELKTMPVFHREVLHRLILSTKSGLVRFAGAYILAHTHLQDHKALEILMASLPVYEPKTSNFQFDKDNKILSAEYFDLVTHLLKVGVSETNIGVQERLSQWPGFPPQMIPRSYPSEVETLKLLLQLKSTALQPGSDGNSNLMRIILDEKESTTRRLTSAYLFSRLFTQWDARQEVGRRLKADFHKKHRRFFWRQFDRQQFFDSHGGFYIQVFRHLQLADPDLVEYLVEKANSSELGPLTARGLASVVLELQIHDARLAEFFENKLSKTEAKDMPFYFQAFVTLFPERVAEILKALYVVRNIPEVFQPYLRTLVQAGTQNPEWLLKLRDARDGRVIPLKLQIAVDGLYLDDWLDSQVARRLGNCDSVLRRRSS